MKLVIGGYAQGKLEYVLRELEREACGNGAGECKAGAEVCGAETETCGEDARAWGVWDGVLPEEAEVKRKRIVINHFHGWVRECLLRGGCPEEEISAFTDKYPQCILISDEIGSGIVPIDGFEREYRERTGRLLVALAAKAEEVVRVICGIGQKIK